MTGNKTQRQMTGLSYRFATILIALLFVATGKLQAQTPCWRVDGSTLTFYCISGSDTQGGEIITEWGTLIQSPKKEIDPNWVSDKNKANITTVVFAPSFASARPTSCFNWFKGFTKLTEIQGIENLNSENVTNMNSMFYECTSLKKLDVSGLNTGEVTNMGYMFYGCSNLNSIDVSSFNTSKVEIMDGMFAHCYSVRSINVTNLNTSNVISMIGMFGACFYLEELNLLDFDTEKVKDMSNMFFNCTYLTTLDLSNFNTSTVQNMESMFSYCYKLKTIYASDKFKVDNVTESTEMFKDCSSLVGVIPYYEKKLEKEWANNVTGYFMPYYEDKDGKHPIYNNGLKKVTRLDLYNENPFYTQTTFNIDEGSYTRQSMLSEWGTVCVPFVIDVAQSNCTFYQLTSVGKDAIEISPITEDEIAAGKSVFVKRNDGETDLKVIAKPCEIVADPANEMEANHLEGTFQDKKISKKCYFLARNKFWYVGQIADDGEIKGVLVYPFRAYLTCDDNAQPANSLNIVVKEETSGVENPVTIDSLFSDKAEYYDVAGRRIDALQKGLNIVRVGGQTRKVIIK